MRYKRALERERHEAEKAAREEEVPKTAAKVQLTLVDRLMQNIDRIHKRV